MHQQEVLVLGAGAAGTAAARVLEASGAVRVRLFGRTGEIPYNRTLVNKGIAVGLLTPDQARLPGVTLDAADTAVEVDTESNTVRFESERVERYDALVVATGSAPRLLNHEIAPDNTRTKRIFSLHSTDDAAAIRDFLTAIGRPAELVISGAGLVAAETATLFHQRGHHVTLLARDTTPGASVFGNDLAQRMNDAHRQRHQTAFGRSISAIHESGNRLAITLDDATRLEADLLIVAHGTTPAAPRPWKDGGPVDASLRAAANVYAAGGVAVHRDASLGTWRIDHWSDAAAQGEHAARTLLADLGVGEQPGMYRPCAPFTATIHDAMIAGAGLTGHKTATHTASSNPLVVVSLRDATAVGVLGIDAVPDVFAWIPRLHQAHVIDADDLASTPTARQSPN